MIYTLYSYKGGVGRSMALANLAECFFQRGLKVVMIDWDLEAPGLENYFYSDSKELSRVTARRGLIDMLREYKEKYPELAQRRMAAAAAENPRQESEPVDGEGAATAEGASSEKIKRETEEDAEITRRFLEEHESPVPAENPRQESEPVDGEGAATADGASSEKIKRETEEVAEITRRFLEKHGSRVPERLRVLPPETPPASPALTFDKILDQGLTSVDRYLEEIARSNEGRLCLLTAGARTRESFADYADAVQDFDWLEFLAKYQGKEYLEWLRHRLAWADVVLIDSRTGVTEMGGVCTRQMGDAVVSFCAPNRQNLEGVARIVSALATDTAKQARFERDLQVLVIPTRIDDSESSPLGIFAKDFDEKLEIQNLPANLIPDRLEGLPKPLWNLNVPYIPKYNYREQVVIGPRANGGELQQGGTEILRRPWEPDPPTKKLIRAYENIAVHLALLSKSDSRMWQAYASEIATQFPQFERKRPQMAPQLPGNWVERPDAIAPLEKAVLASANAPTGGRVAVCGLAGMGKTSLVARLCQVPEIVGAFPDGIVWLTLEGAVGNERVQEFLRTSFGIPRHGGEIALAQTLESKRFLWVVDDVWTPEQLTHVLRWGKRCTYVIVTRDRAIASRFADTVINVGYLTRDESRELLKIPAAQRSAFEKDDALTWMLDWPLGTSLLAAALERYSAEAGSPARAGDLVIEQLKKSGLKLLDRPGTPGRNASVALSLRETLGRLLPGERKTLVDIARGASSDQHGETHDTQRLRDLGLVSVHDDVLRVHGVIQRWLLGQGELTEDAEATRKKERTETLKKGYDILRGRGTSLTEMQQAADRAKDIRAFSLARKLYKKARGSPEAAALSAGDRLKLIQRHALCTYKDDDLVADARFQDALDILNEGDLQSDYPSQETLGQAGAVHKGKWRLSGQRHDLERSLHYYERGAGGTLEGDYGYTRINTAFVLDLLAKQEERDAPTITQARRERAARLREEIAAELPGVANKPENAFLKEQWWYGATMAEALFGLKRYSEARHWLREAIALDPPAWQLETTTRQMAMLASVQDVNANEDTEAWRTLAMLVGDSPEALRAITAGKLGLALSGGGFRASLFHIGVLARLAELDVLRHVEVLSCVSGGSIIGAHYYLEVRRLLQEKRDAEITREDYIEIVKRLEQDFLAGVQKNLRVRLLAGWLANWKSLLIRGYTRTQYLGEMFERYIYSRVEDGEKGKRWLNLLKVTPKDAGEDFNPRLDNWRRAAKVPILLLNATSLNTGHVWQFAVSWMGEPPESATSSVDSNDLLRRMYYDEAPVKYQQVRLGHAVAASACVPALFDPIEFDALFPRRRLRLVDGGVHDNQGTAGLLEQECSVVLVSDASGQMNSEPKPSGNVLPVLMRSNSISMARVREAEFRELNTLRRSSALGGLMFLHLKKDLPIHRVDWVDCQDPYEASANPTRARVGTTLTSYGVPTSVQALLAGMRTDLDTFSDAEAYALMLSGYRMTSAEFKTNLPDFPVVDISHEPWRFLAIEPTVDRATDFEPDHDRLRRLLSVGGGRWFKPFRLRPFASWAMLIFVLIFVVPLFLIFLTVLFDFARAAITGLDALFRLIPPSVGWEIEPLLGWKSAAGIASAILVSLAIWQRRTSSVLITGTIMVTGGWLAARIHLWFFERIYRGAGAVRQRSGKSNR